MDLIVTPCPHVLAFVRSNNGNRLIVLANFSEHPQAIPGNLLRTRGFGRFFLDHISGETVRTPESFTLDRFQVCWLERA